MKFTVDVEDFWLEEEELSDALVSHVKLSVVAQIEKLTKDKVEKQITDALNKVIEEKILLVIDNTLQDLIATGTFIPARHSSEPISFIQHIRNKFNSNDRWNNPNEYIKEQAIIFGNEMKIRYDSIFAMHVVDNLKKQGMLNDKVVQLLLEGDGKS